MNKKVLIWVILFLSSLIIASGWYFGVTKYIDYKDSKNIEEVNALLQQKETKAICNTLLNFDQEKVSWNKQFNADLFSIYKQKCDKKYNIANIETTLDNCKKIIKSSVWSFSEQYLILDDYNNIQKECSEKYLKITFGTGAFFNVNNDFKSNIDLEFSLPFYTDTWILWSDEYIENRINAKKRLISLLTISPEVEVLVEDVVLYPKKWTISLNLEPLTSYNISLQSFTNWASELQTKNEVFTFNTPENKFLWIQINNPVSLYMDTNPPEFELIKYNLEDKKETTVKICRIDNENYAKIEVLRWRKEAKKEMEDFFLTWIDELDTYDCKEKVVSLLPSPQTSDWVKEEVQKERDATDTLLVRKKINFDEEIWEVSRSGLYYVTFSDKEDRNVNNNLQFPIFFGIIDSHITMKVSKNGEGYFFVNDFKWNPLSDQEIRVYVNKFIDNKKVYNRKTKQQDITYFSPLDRSVLWEEILLWKTNSQWVLVVNLEEKIEWAFKKTFSSEWSYQFQWVNESFFVTSASKNHLTYNHSHWNAWIAPWNFWYTIDSNWYWDEWANASVPSLRSYGKIEKEFYSHIYTDRMLYFPWEEVNIKSVIRRSKDLSIPKNKDFELIVKNSKNKEILNSKLKLSEYWSLSEKLKLDKTSLLGSYTIILKDDNGEYAKWYFSVEVFKNPKFTNDVSLQTIWLNGEEVKIDETTVGKNNSWRKNYEWKFQIEASINSKYYNWGVVQNAEYTYKVYKQHYYGNSYWDNCYWGCFWEPKKVFYTEWKWTLDENWKAENKIDIAFESNYDDYKYIIEVTVTDKAWETITGSNSIVAKLPAHLKRWNHNASLKFEAGNNYYKKWEKVSITWWLSQWKWTADYDNKYIFIIKKKDYKTNYIDDVRWYKRPVTVPEERLEKILLVNSTAFKIGDDWKLALDFVPEETWEYVFEYGKINPAFFEVPDNKDKDKELLLLIDQFNKEKTLKIDRWVQELFLMDPNYGVINFLHNNCIDSKENCKRQHLRNVLECRKTTIISGETVINECSTAKSVLSLQQKISLDTLLDSNKSYFAILSYGDEDAQNPIVSDNKVRVLSEKVSYKLWEVAKIMIRLPFSKWKILWTVEKQWVLKKEYIDVTSNMFFKEVLVDDTFVPNAYIWVVAIETPESKTIPEYKVWYTEIVVDKSDKKSFVEIKTNKKIYKPREKVVLDITNTLANKTWKQSELTVMVVDDSLISLMWNVDLNTLEKFYKKLPFQVQTSLTNLAMLKNYYFSRPWIVGWSGFWNFKWWDSAVSSRTIFKNTAYFNPTVITNQSWTARVEFELPDNLTNFRVMVVSNSKDNFFWYASENIEVRKNVVIEDKTPLIYRLWDRTEIGAQIFNQTDQEIWFKVQFKSEDIEVNKPERLVVVWPKTSENVTFWTAWTLDKDTNLNYQILALWDSVENSDILEKTIENKEFPSLKSVFSTGWLAQAQKVQNLKINIPENADLEKSTVKISFSNNVLEGIQDTLNSLLVYPYGCIEQTMSSTYPNAVLLSFSELFPWIISKEEAEKNLETWMDRITSMQLANWWFGYWQGDTETNLHITPYVLRRIVDMKKLGTKVPEKLIEKAQKYLENNFSKIEDNTARTETFYAFAKLWEWEKAYNALLKNIDISWFSRHELIAYTYWLITWDKAKNKTMIDENITKIFSKLNDSDSNSWYWSELSDKALFTSLLIDYWYDSPEIEKLIKELYWLDWSNYYYSTTAKNNAFIAFAKYMQKYGSSASSNFAFSIWAIHNRDKRFDLWGNKPNLITREFRLKDIVQYKENHIELTTYVLSWRSIFTNLQLQIFPEDKFKIEEVNNGMSVEREVFEVLDVNNIDNCSAIYYWRDKASDCDSVLKKVEDNIYKKWSYYKVWIKVSFDEDRQRRNVALEDYIPSTFKVINSKFKTESSATKAWNKKSWSWNHVEYLKDRVFANASNAWWNDLYFEYMVTPEFEWEFIYPPVSAYMMYDWEVRAHSTFEKIEVK